MVFDPRKMDWAAEGGGSTRLAPISLPRPNYGTAGASGSLFGTPERQRAGDPRPGETARSIVSQNPTILTKTTDPAGTPPKPPLYPTVLPSLSANQLGALAERRRLADERVKSAEALKTRDEQLLQASSLRQRQNVERNSKRDIRSFMTEAAGKGLARSPMVAGRQLRTAGEDLRLKYGEIDTRLSTEIMALQDMVARASEERNMELARIEQDKVNMQANLEAMFPAMYMYQ
jgi:hypothetical protein